MVLGVGRMTSDGEGEKMCGNRRWGRKKERVRSSICWMLLGSRVVVPTLMTTGGGGNSLTMMKKKVDCDGRLGSLCFKIIHSSFFIFFLWWGVLD